MRIIIIAVLFAAGLGGCIQVPRTPAELRAMSPLYSEIVALPYQKAAACWSAHHEPTYVDFKKSSNMVMFQELGYAEITTGGFSLMLIKRIDDKSSQITAYTENIFQDVKRKWLETIKKCERGELQI